MAQAIRTNCLANEAPAGLGWALTAVDFGGGPMSQTKAPSRRQPQEVVQGPQLRFASLLLFLSPFNHAKGLFSSDHVYGLAPPRGPNST